MIPEYPAGLQAQLTDALTKKGAAYVPRTQHLNEDGSPVYTNRLILEDSPYLIQHAHNPVDWWPWGDEAFEVAAQQNKPVFLSIGYSTCHWCHVMEHESFDNVEIANILNQHFIAIKVDREQRPDIDETYMAAVMLTSGRGGWPMSTWLTPQGKPFMGGTYFPPQQFARMLSEVATVWQNKADELRAHAERLSDAMHTQLASHGEVQAIGNTAITRASSAILSRFDAQLGGFGHAPKFPGEPSLLLLLEQWRRNHAADVQQAVEVTLDAMARGGLHDQVGGGFHRYSVDERWLVPHFEKMLYNQALLSRVYVQAWALTGDAWFESVARNTLDYVLREMTDAQGRFYSATDADSADAQGHLEEGLYFTWTPAELKQALNAEDAALVIDLYNVTSTGNFEGRNILHLQQSLSSYAAAKDLAVDTLLQRLDDIHARLREVRDRRPLPLRDDKIITAWNGLMITAFAEAALWLNEPRYAQAASKAAEFIWNSNRKSDNADGFAGLWRVNLNGSSSVTAGQDDYAAYAESLIALYDLTAEKHWLDQATAVTDDMLGRFWDAEHGGLFMSESAADETDLGPQIIRPKDGDDGALPSGNSIALRVLAQLYRRADNEVYRQRAEGLVNAFSSKIADYPQAFAYMMKGLDELLHGEIGPVAYAANGHVIIRASRQGENVQVTVHMQPGWHIQSHQPLQENLLPTEVTGLQNIRYPQHTELSLGFSDQPVAVYQGRIEIIVPGSDAKSVTLSLQACDDQVCLPPEKISLPVLH